MKLPSIGLRTAVLALLACASVGAQDPPAGVLFAGTDLATPYYVVSGGRSGPTVMVTGGIHGNEPAGARAAGQIRQWVLEKGRLVVLPVCNRPALAARNRYQPGVPKALRNLNRNFPVKKGEPPRGQLAAGIWKLVLETRPDWLLDLHEGYDFTQINKKSVGSSIITSSENETRHHAQAMLEAVNATISEEKKKFVLKRQVSKDSLARSAALRLGIGSMILETTKKKQPVSMRVRQHRLMVHQFLRRLGMVKSGVHTLVSKELSKGTIRVALYDARGVGGEGPQAMDRRMRGSRGMTFRRIGAEEIRSGSLEQFDAVIHPGGSGSGQARALGPKGRAAVRAFVKRGGGYIGVCAGSYLAACNYEWSLGLVDAEVIDRKHWRRGKGQVKIELTPRGKEILGAHDGLLDCRYANGPILQAGKRPSIPDFFPLAFFRSDMAKNGAPRGVMPGTPAIVAGTFGKGRVISISPHPEQSKALDDFVPRAVRWVAGSN